MAKSKQDIIDEIKAHIQKEGSGYRKWYVGISEDAKDRLFNVTEYRRKMRGGFIVKPVPRA